MDFACANSVAVGPGGVKALVTTCVPRDTLRHADGGRGGNCGLVYSSPYCAALSLTNNMNLNAELPFK